MGQSIVAGIVRGVVKDSTGAPLGNVRVALTDRESGFTHAMVTSRAGRFRFPFLPVGEYDLLAERLGFRPVEVNGVVVEASGDAEVEITLLAVEPPVLERAVTGFGHRLDRAVAGPGWTMGRLELRRLADERRDLSSALRFSTLVDDALVIEGLPASYTQLSVEGLPFRFPQHPLIGQFQPSDLAFPVSAFAGASVDPGGADVEWTDFTAGRVNGRGVRGTNRLRARLSADWAPTSLARSKYYDPQDLSGHSVRGSVLLSGPVLRDTAHFVLGLEAQRLETPLPSAWEPNGSDTALVAAADSLGVDLANYRAPRLARTRMVSGFGRFDWRPNLQNRLAVLAFGELLEGDDPPLGYGRAVALGARQEGWDVGLGATLTSVLGGSVALELRVGFQIGEREYLGNDTTLTVTTAGPAAWGTDPAIPGRFRRSGLQASDALHIAAGSHQLKLGVSSYIASHDEDYAYARGGAFAFGRPDDLLSLDGGFAQTVGRVPLAKFTNYQFGWFLQDRWLVAPGAEFLIGLRMDWEHLDRGALVRNTQLMAAGGVVNDLIDATALKLSPRAGMSWDVGNKHTWVVRADGGIYRGTVPTDAFAEAVAEAGGLAARYGLGALGRWPTAPDSTVAPPAGAHVSVLPPGFSAPRSTKAALGVSGALAAGFTLHLAGSYRHTEFLVRRRDLNRVPGEVGRDQYGRPIYGELEQHGNALLATPGSGRRLADFSVVNALNQDGESDYFGVTARLERRLGRFLTLSGGYTYSQTTDNIPGIALGPDAQLSPFPDSLNGVDWSDGPGDFDVPHRFVVGSELAFAGFRLAAFYAFRTGRPFTPGFRDGVDANGDGSWRNDPAYVDDTIAGVTDLFPAWDCLRQQVGRFAARNSCRGSALKTLDLRLAVGPFRLGYPVELVVDALNLLDTEFAEVDRALFLVDPAGSLSRDPATGVVTIPLLANPDFGRVIRRYGSGRYLRVGIRVNYE